MKRLKKRKSTKLKKGSKLSQLTPDERKTLSTMVKLWLNAHPELIEAHVLIGGKGDESEIVENTLSLIDKGILKLEVTEYDEDGMVRLRMLMFDKDIRKWTVVA